MALEAVTRECVRAVYASCKTILKCIRRTKSVIYANVKNTMLHWRSRANARRAANYSLKLLARKRPTAKYVWP
jgi:hypothetical protein